MLRTFRLIPHTSPLRMLALGCVCLGISACPATVRNAPTVRSVNFTGLHDNDPDAIRGRIALRETSIFPLNRPSWLRWWRWWWVDPEYFDETSLTRDRLRVLRYLQARGYYDAEVLPPRVSELGTERIIDFEVHEGAPTRVADVRLRGCEPGDALLLPGDWCQRIRERLSMAPGDLFDEATFAHDREQVLDFTREAGFATPTIVPRAVVDPSTRLAWVDYTIRPGPRSRFGEIRLYAAPSRTPISGDSLANGLPVNPILTAIGIDSTTPYSRQALAQAQQSLFNLGVFGIARIEEVPHPNGVVDLEVLLSTTGLWRFRAGFGALVDTRRSDVHLLVTYEHRNFLGGMRRLRLDVRPLVYLSGFSSETFSWVLGITAAAELQQPEISPHATGILNGSFEYSPDPINPRIAFRVALRTGIGLDFKFSRDVSGTFFLRTTNVTYVDYPQVISGVGLRANDLDANPLLRQQFFNRNYVHFEQAFTWDRRDNKAAPTRGTYLALNLAEGTRSPVSDYTFLRIHTEARGFLPVSRRVTLAMRGAFGAVVGSSIFDANLARWYWPVPPELRFFSGGAQSNRGYPVNAVGLAGAATQPGTNGPSSDNPGGYNYIGGTAMWEGSMELRWQPGAFGMVAFFDASNVTGIDPSPYTDPMGVNRAGACSVTATNRVTDRVACGAVNTRTTDRDVIAQQIAAPPPRPLQDAVGSLVEFSTWDALIQSIHPSIGIGIRYMTPVGPLRLDLGFRLADLGCDRTRAQVARQNAAVASRDPASYVMNQPRCDLLFWDTIPATIHFSIGEAY
jgi:translocation and assembly module TamA